MRFSVLASGSSGNAIYIENDEHSIFSRCGFKW